MTDLPIGTVTFFFSDIEGSTKMLQRLGAGFREVLEQHGQIVRAALRAHNGIELGTEGDSFFAVFTTAPDAVEAAGTVQQQLADAEWPEGGTVKVRIGLHTGSAELGGEGYVGLDVNRAARISAAGHGGQVVVSETTRALAANGKFIDLGTHRLKDLEQPEHLHQLRVPDLPTSFPPLRSLDARPNNLPTLATQLLGRDDETAHLLDRIRQHRLVTIIGLGGVGKTHLAINVAAAALPDFTAGAFFVDLAPITDPSLVLSTIAAELGIDESEPAAMAAALGPGRLLIVLDNLEQVIDVAPSIGELLSAHADLAVLATSQVPLRVSGENVFRLDPLGVTGNGSSNGNSPAVDLFATRAATADPAFSLADHVPEVIELVAALDGLPLAVELAASRVNVLTPAQILERLQRDTAVLETRAADAPQRHRSLQAAISWSYGLLTPGQQGVLRTLSVFRGGATLAAIESLATRDVIDDLAELVDRSLVRTSITTSGKQFDLLDSVLRYAAARLDEGESAELKERHTRFFSEMGSSAAAGLTDDRGPWWMASLSDDHENLQAALGRMLDTGDFPRGFDFLGSTWRYYQGAGRLGELWLWLERFFGLPGSDETSAPLAKALMARGAAKYWRSDFVGAAADYGEAVDIALSVGDRQLEADARFGIATSMGNAGVLDEAQEALGKARQLYEQLDDAFGQAGVVSFEAFFAMRVEGFAAGVDRLTAAVKLLEESGRRVMAAQAILGFCVAAIAEGKFDEAKRQSLRSLDLAEQAGDRFVGGMAVEVMATALIASGDLETGTLLAGSAAAARDRWDGGWSSMNFDIDNAQTRAVAALGEDAALELMAQGAKLSLDQAIEMARSA